MRGSPGGWLLSLLVTVFMTCPCLGQDTAIPMMHVAETVRKLPAVFEGQTVSAAFTVENHGRAELEILKVAPS